MKFKYTKGDLCEIVGHGTYVEHELAIGCPVRIEGVYELGLDNNGNGPTYRITVLEGGTLINGYEPSFGENDYFAIEADLKLMYEPVTDEELEEVFRSITLRTDLTIPAARIEGRPHVP